MITRQDPITVAPNNYKVLLENDKIRVLEVTMRPGDTIEMHDHPDMVAYAVTDIENVWTFPDAPEEDVFVKKGEAIYHEAFSHGAENTGDSDMKVFLVELKK